MPLQVRMLTQKSLDAEKERSQRKTSMIPKSELRIEANTATRVGGTRRPRTSGSASHCISYTRDDNGNRVNARIFSGSTRKPNRRKQDALELQALAAEVANNAINRTPEEVAALCGIQAPVAHTDKRFDHDFTTH